MHHTDSQTTTYLKKDIIWLNFGQAMTVNKYIFINSCSNISHSSFNTGCLRNYNSLRRRLKSQAGKA